MDHLTVPFHIIARIHTDFPAKFGIPRQSGLVDSLEGRIIFEPEYRRVEAFRGLEDFSHVWLLWQFSEAKKENWAPLVKPPRLGGEKKGVWATRSPFRPNAIGLSSVKLVGLELDEIYGPVLVVSGVDLLDGTPIFDIKPYLPYVDSHPEAKEGYTARTKEHLLEVDFPEALKEKLPERKRQAAVGVLSQDPRPAYDEYEDRVYGVSFAGFDIRFTVAGNRLTVVSVETL